MTAQRTHIVVIGGGYAGTLAANHLRLRADVDITVVNPRPVFVERIRLHQMIAGSGSATVDYGTLLGMGIRLVVDGAERINTARGTVELTSGALVNYDYLIYAVGSTGVVPAAVPGAVEFAYPIAEFEQAERLRGALDELHPAAPVTVVGAGLTGIETASELAEQGRRVTLVCGGTLGPSLSNAGRRSAAKWLRRLGVDVLETARVDEVRSDAVVLGDGAVLPSAVTVWTAGFGVPDLADRSGLRTDALGRLITDETLTSVDDPRIVAAGDAAAPSGHPLRMSCQAAGPLGVQAANTVLSRIAGTPAAALSQMFVGQCISLGRSYATLQLARTDDTPVNIAVGGRITASIKEAVCRATVWSIRREAAKPGSYPLRKGGKKRAERLAFALLRPLLFTIAYEIIGSTTESDDVLQDSYLRWSQVDLSGVHDTKSYLARLVTRQALNTLRAGARRREDYVGPWLPEPLMLEEQDPSADVVLAESVSMAMLVLLETLSPDERAVFVLREVFGFDYHEIAAAVDKSVAAVRQIAHRAHEHVQARRRRFAPVDPQQNARITAEFMAAAAGGDVQKVMSMLSPDVVWTADSGGKASAARRPVTGADKVARALVGMISRGLQLPGVRAEMATCNSAPAVVIYTGERLEGVFTVEIIDGKITNFYAMRNPDKLTAVATVRKISRG